MPPVTAGAPRALRTVVALLITNLALSVCLTLAVFVMHRSVVDYQLDHLRVTGSAARAAAVDAANHGLWTRTLINVVASVAYAFLVRALSRGRRWAYRRVVTIGVAGAITLLVLQTEPRPAWIHLEQIAQIFTLVGLVIAVTRPAVRDHFARGLPGRDVRRFRRT